MAAKSVVLIITFSGKNTFYLYISIISSSLGAYNPLPGVRNHYETNIFMFPAAVMSSKVIVAIHFLKANIFFLVLDHFYPLFSPGVLTISRYIIITTQVFKFSDFQRIQIFEFFVDLR